MIITCKSKLEPLHRMYLNTIDTYYNGNGEELEPLHRMYLNLYY